MVEMATSRVVRRESPAKAPKVRRLDQHVGPMLDRLREIFPWMSANKMSVSRGAVWVPLFYLCFWLFPPALSIVNLLDGVSDVGDGIWARRFDELSRLGRFLDQLFDKISTWLRLPGLYIFVFSGRFILDGPVWDGGLTWLELSLIFAFLFDMVNLVIRTVQYVSGESEVSAPFEFGKIKAWFQGFGVAFLSLVFAAMWAEEHDALLALATCTGLACWGIAMIIPPIRGRTQLTDPVWYLLVLSLLGVCTLALHPATRFLVQCVGEFALYGALVLGALSTGGQLFRLMLIKHGE